jgi:ABC-type lipoprotein export system ATPase subunit
VTAVAEAREVFRVYPGPDGGSATAALQGLSLRVEEGELCVVLGPSGSGKTTLLRLLAGFERPSAGSVAVAGVELGALPERRLAALRAGAIGYADQHYWRALAPEATLEEQIAIPLGLAGRAAAERRSRACELLERVGLLDRAGARPAELSGGEQQRVALCVALASRPRLLLADEPTGELDAATAAEVYGLLLELVRESGAAALVVSHDAASTRIADRVVHVRDGRVSEEHGAEGSTVVVGRGGWLRVPEEALAAAGIGVRARVEVGEGAVLLRPAAAEPATVLGAPPPAVEGAAGAPVVVRAVSRRFGKEQALHDLDARFEPGRVTAVTGPSGSGKSTLLRLVAGLDLPDEGEVRVGGVVVSGLSREERAGFRARSVAFVGQTPGLTGFLTARENAELGLAVRGCDDGDAAARADEALTAVGLAEHAGRPVEQLSAGQRERVALARALAARPAVLLVDEPTARLDTEATIAIGGLLVRIAAEHRTTVVCATHDPLLIGLAAAELRLGSR